MCLILFAYRVVPGARLIVAANRDEYFARPAAPAALWADHPEILAGRDLSAGAKRGGQDVDHFGVVVDHENSGGRDLHHCRDPTYDSTTLAPPCAQWLNTSRNRLSRAPLRSPVAPLIWKAGPTEHDRFVRIGAQIRPSLLDPYRAFITAALDQYPRLRATRLFAMLRDRGFAGSVVQLRRYVRAVRPTARAEAYLRLDTLKGERQVEQRAAERDAQVDRLLQHFPAPGQAVGGSTACSR